jgi:RNA polymerase sigma-54 factor
MAFTQRLELRQSKSLVMTPQLQQALKLLQLSNLDLTGYLDQELEQNPLLERAPEDDATLGEASAAGEGEAPGEAPGGEEPAATADSAELAKSDQLPGADDSPLDADYDSLLDPGSSSDWGALAGGAGGGSAGQDPDRSLDLQLCQEPSLRDHLLAQLQMEVSDPVARLIGLHLIDMLDESGYLVGELAGVAELLGCEPATVEQTLATMQGFDPPGILARDLRESLALQLADQDRLDPAMAALLDNLDLLAAGDLGRLRRICAVDQEDLAEMIAEVKALDPKPALVFDHRVAETVVPDIILRAQPDGGWHLELNNGTLPRVLVNNQYHARLAKQARDKAERDYLVERLQSANWLVKALHQRATTILKVATEIVRQQDAFFRKGVQHLRPLILRDIAEAVSMHESTVSRVTANKYLASPRGIYELKYFFTSAIAGTREGAVHSAESVRHRIRRLIDGEAPGKVHSDDTIVALLRADGIDIARRTVAKYRDAMRIPSSVQRRREKLHHL